MTDVVRSATLAAQLDPSGYERGAQVVNLESARMTESVSKVEMATRQAGSSARLTAEGFEAWLSRIDPATRAGDQYSKAISQLTEYQRAGLVSTGDLAIAQAAIKAKFEDTTHATQENSLAFKAMDGAASFLANTIVSMLGIFTVDRIVEFGRAIFEQAAQVEREAQVLQMSTDALQAFQESAKLVGVETETADTAIRRFVASMGQAQEGVTPARRAFEQLGIPFKDLAGSPEALLPKVAEAFLNIQDPGERARLAMQLFGRAGAELFPAMKQWQGSTDDLIERMKALGLVMDKTLPEAAHESEEKITAAFDRLKTSAAEPVIYLTDKLTALLDVINNFQQADIWQKLGVVVGAAAAGPIGLYGTLARLAPEKSSPGSQSPIPDPLGQPGGAGFGGDTTVLTGTPSSATNNGYPTPDLDKYMSALRLRAQIASESRAQQAADNELIAAANEKLKDTSGTQKDYVASVTEARIILGQTLSTEIERLAKQKELTGESQKLSDQEAKRQEKLKQELADVVSKGELEAKYAGEARDIRAEDLKIAEMRLKYGALLTAEIEKQIRASDATVGQTKATDAIAQLQDQVTLAGMIGEKQKEEAEVLKLIHETNGAITEDQKNQVRNLVEMKDQAAEWAKVETKIEDSFTGFLTNVIKTGKFNFKSLFDSILGAWADMLGQMLKRWLETQALMGSSGGAGGAGGGGFLGGLFSLLGAGGGGKDAIGGGAMSLFAGFFDDGGAIGAGATALVGESGPELFTPNVPGVITPMAANDNRSVVVNVNVVAPGATPGMDARIAQLSRQAVMEAAPMLVAASHKSVSDRLRDTGRGGL